MTILIIEDLEALGLQTSLTTVLPYPSEIENPEVSCWNEN
jgi:hypothetical protein